MARARGVLGSMGDKAREVSKEQAREGFECLMKSLDLYSGCSVEPHEKNIVIRFVLERSLSAIRSVKY